MFPAKSVGPVAARRLMKKRGYFVDDDLQLAPSSLERKTPVSSYEPAKR
jgi:hypothetical protein